MTTTVSTHKTSLQLSKWFDSSIFIFGHSIDNNSPRQNISSDNSISNWTLPNVFYSFLFPPLFLPFDKRAVWLSPIATNLFATQTTAPATQINPLQSLTHFFGFFKPSFAITNLTDFVFARDRQKQNQLNFPTHKIGLLRSLFAHLTPFNQKRKPQAYGILFLSTTKNCLTSFYKKNFRFPLNIFIHIIKP